VTEIPQGAGQAVQLPDDQDISLAKMVQQTVQLRTVPAASGRLFPEYPFICPEVSRFHPLSRIGVCREF
jgi:hypothetical protein